MDVFGFYWSYTNTEKRTYLQKYIFSKHTYQNFIKSKNMSNFCIIILQQVSWHVKVLYKSKFLLGNIINLKKVFACLLRK